MKKTTFNYLYRNGWIDLNTLSPNEEYFYKLKSPHELNKAAYGVEIAFYSVYKELIYHRGGFYAHELHTKEDVESMRGAIKSGRYDLIKPVSNLEFVKWSKEGNMVFLFEYYSWNYDKIFESVFINLKEKFCYRINELENNFEIISQIRPIDQTYSEKQVVITMNSLGFTKESLIADRINNFKIFGKKWRP